MSITLSQIAREQSLQHYSIAKFIVYVTCFLMHCVIDHGSNAHLFSWGSRAHLFSYYNKDD